MKIKKHIRNSILFTIAMSLSFSVFAQKETIGFEFTKRCQYEVAIQNTSYNGHYAGYLWEVLIDGHIDGSFTSPLEHPVFSFDDPSPDIQIRLIAYKKNNTGTDSLTKSLELIIPPIVEITGSNTVICSHEENVLFETNYLEGYDYKWEVSPAEFLESKFSDVPNRVITNWKSTTSTQQINISLTLTNTSTEGLCNYEFIEHVLLIPVNVPLIQDNSLVRKAPESNILLSLNGSNNSFLYRWGYGTTLIKTDTLPWCEYDAIVPGTDYWAVILDRTYSSCASDTLKYSFNDSKNFDIGGSNNSGIPEVLLYPNPVHRNLTLKILDSGFADAEVLISVKDHTGRKINTPEAKAIDQGVFMVTLPDHLNGLFFMEIIFDGNIRVVKKVIVR